ncbi:MAG: ATP-binding cassette domain-containing protein [Clostridia bacterium]|nr:ATP-binding cassette domain-containing protein [Clostridia bacterium]
MVVKKLCKRYRTESGEKIVFDNFSAEFKDGKVTAVMGSSGIGKTTLLNCIAKLTDYDGEIAGVGSSAYVFQEDRLIPDKTVYDNIDFVMQTEDADERKKRIKNALSVTELLSEAFRYPSELSGGQRKRVSLARAFACGRELMLLDEPLSSLDIGLKFRIFDVMKRVFKSDSKTVIMVTHDVDEALTLADEIVIIEKGGVAYRKEFSTDLFGRDITDDECNRIRKEIIEILKA